MPILRVSGNISIRNPASILFSYPYCRNHRLCRTRARHRNGRNKTTPKPSSSEPDPTGRSAPTVYIPSKKNKARQKDKHPDSPASYGDISNVTFYGEADSYDNVSALHLNGLIINYQNL